jgi:membrane-bound lytic murein transglycosylase D
MMKNKIIWFVGGLLTSIFLFIMIAASGSTDGITNLSASIKETVFPQGYKITTPAIPVNLSFAGESVPADDWELRERIEREFIVNTYWHSSTIFALKRGARFFPVIEPILKKNNIPDDFKFVVVIESGFANVVSPAGAAGFWQFIESAGKEFGLEINDEVDERYHLEKATEAASKYILSAYRKFGSWTSAAASFNMGMRGVERQIERQKTNNYYNLFLNEETSRYIARIIAVKEIMNDHQKYGYDIPAEERYPPYKFKEVTVNGSINDLVDFALRNNTNYKMIKVLNPWLRSNKLTNSKGKTYNIRIPVNY